MEDFLWCYLLWKSWRHISLRLSFHRVSNFSFSTSFNFSLNIAGGWLGGGIIIGWLSWTFSVKNRNKIIIHFLKNKIRILFTSIDQPQPKGKKVLRKPMATESTQYARFQQQRNVPPADAFQHLFFGKIWLLWKID